jgi:hypothetical protein
MNTYTIRIFNFATGDFDGVITLGPLHVGYYRNCRNGLYVVTLVLEELVRPRQTVKVEPELMRQIMRTEFVPVCGLHAFEPADLIRMGFDLQRRRNAP